MSLIPFFVFDLASPQSCDFGGLCRIIIVNRNSCGSGVSRDATTTFLLVMPKIVERVFEMMDNIVKEMGKGNIVQVVIDM